MGDREKSGEYGEDGIPNSHAEYIAGMGLGQYPSRMYPYYFFRPDLLADRVQGAPCGQYDMKYPGSQVPQTSHPINVCGYPESPADQDMIRTIWKKEKNRLAAKKSREKKMIHLKELERREHIIVCEMAELKEAVFDYDNILKSLLEYIEESLGRNKKRREDFVFLLERLCHLKKPGASKPTYLHDVGHLVSEDLSVTNEKIDKITGKIRDSLSNLFEKG